MIPWRRDAGPYLDDGVLFNADAVGLDLLRRLLPLGDLGPCAAFALIRRGRVEGAAAFSNWHPERSDVGVTAAFVDPFWWSPRTLRRVFTIGFVDIGANRLTINTADDNKAARQFAKSAGFKLEGVRREAWDGRRDLLTFGLLKRECRFLKG